MLPAYDIFRLEKDGSVTWQDAKTTLEKAKALIEVLAMSAPAQYIIVNYETGRRIVITPGTKPTNRAA
jgi:hypothetical protein